MLQLYPSSVAGDSSARSYARASATHLGGRWEEITFPTARLVENLRLVECDADMTGG
jgi:hypothetical protein